MSTGTASSSAAVCWPREPVTTSTSARTCTDLVSWKFCSVTAPGFTVTFAVAGAKRIIFTRTVCTPVGTPCSVYRPCALLGTLIAVLSTLTAAPATGAPVLSVMSPWIVPACA